MNFTQTVGNCPVVLVILISNTAVNTYETYCEASSQVMKLEGRISSQFHANKKQYDMN